jgi:hypothetical protein
MATPLAVVVSGFDENPKGSKFTLRVTFPAYGEEPSQTFEELIQLNDAKSLDQQRLFDHIKSRVMLRINQQDPARAQAVINWIQNQDWTCNYTDPLTGLKV